MGVCYYLFDKKGAKGICLGKAGHRTDAEFDGPVAWLDGCRYHLPSALLQQMIDRFTAEAGPENVVVLPEYELFDGEEHLAWDAEYVDIGGDIGPSLSVYLPELETTSGREAIVRSGRRIG
ncbi:hypothetical protein ACQ859_19700 [Roseateles chitinivorans]|uniref:hypothetical protein n=1 Tax=Roseateles chitinivorans TaxID=2917965 RepID=UPI003D66FD25